MRWLLVRRRRLTIQQRREARENAQRQTPDVALPDAAGIEVQEEPMIDLGAISQQAREMLHVLTALATVCVAWLIWKDVLPALGLLDNFVLWRVAIAERVEEVSLQDLLVAMFVFGITFVAIKNMPGLLELFLLQRLPMDAGARYAVTTIFRYLITVVGVILGLSFLSIPWSQYGWLVAAATVGIGFGLQEIVANFVSGLILLMERPIRVGDVVTMGDVTGIVSRIQMRATTITNWDRQELIVPNKDFITGKFLNWTLSNVINRILIRVGVAYGTDPDRVRELIIGVIRELPDVLNEPGPIVTFDGFGDSSLDFTVCCYLPGLEKRWETIHEMHSGINRAFKRAGIEIPFPQRDVHFFNEAKSSQDNEQGKAT